MIIDASFWNSDSCAKTSSKESNDADYSLEVSNSIDVFKSIQVPSSDSPIPTTGEYLVGRPVRIASRLPEVTLDLN